MIRKLRKHKAFSPIHTVKIRLYIVLTLICGLIFNSAAFAGVPHLILVNKKSNELIVAEYQKDDSFKVLKTFHTTMGKVKGDKEEEGDLKTPEGVYQLRAKLVPPTLKPKFGVMAFTVNYPNAFDDIAGRTGSHIMVHGTDTPDRMKLDFDSEGCVVLSNENMKEVEPYVRLGLTPILIFDQILPEYMNGQKSERLHKFFDSWIHDWENKNIDGYMSHYHTDFVGQGRDRAAWKNFKEQLNKKYSSISVGASSPYFFKHPKYTMMMFTQDYRSKLKGGGNGLVSRGTKILYIAEENGEPKIVSENYTEQMW